MKPIFTILFTLLISTAVFSQNCTKTTTGLPAINDLGTGMYQGYMGGLYPGGSNILPDAHRDNGLAMASQIQCLDTSGMPDAAKGKIVWISIGMSNTTQETQVFLPMANAYSGKNPNLVLVDGAQGGQDINLVLDFSSGYWPAVMNRLSASGVTAKQVQAVWFKEAQISPTDTVFPHHADTLKAKFKTAMQLLKTKFPNIKVCYLTCRIYAGYATSALNPEPYAWESGWAIKWLIEDQINGDTALAFSGNKIKAPWIAWGPYIWADGTTPNAGTGLTWICPTDYISDGTHPSTAGRQKVATQLLNFFTTDTTTKSWFVSPGCLATSVADRVDNDGITVYPNPVGNKFTVYGLRFTVGAVINIYNVLGKKVYSATPLKMINSKPETEIDVSGLAGGVYFLQINTGNSIFCTKIVRQ